MIIYTNMTEKETLRQPVLKGFRKDKNAEDCIQSE